VNRNPDSVSILLLQNLANLEKWLIVTPAPNDHDDNIKLWDLNLGAMLLTLSAVNIMRLFQMCALWLEMAV
jgi:hypothetical protein